MPCPQVCEVAGAGFRKHFVYKDLNRHLLKALLDLRSSEATQCEESFIPKESINDQQANYAGGELDSSETAWMPEEPVWTLPRLLTARCSAQWN